MRVQKPSSSLLSLLGMKEEMGSQQPETQQSYVSTEWSYFFGWAVGGSRPFRRRYAAAPL